MLKRKRIRNLTGISEFLKAACLILLTAVLLSSCATPISETETTEANRDFLDQLISDTESEPIDDSEQNGTEAISDVVIDTEANITTKEEPETTEKSPETTKKIEETTTKSEETTKKVDSTGSNMVWIPTKGGKKYHKSSDCSNMDGPREVTISEAKSLGFTACKRCYK